MSCLINNNSPILKVWGGGATAFLGGAKERALERLRPPPPLNAALLLIVDGILLSMLMSARITIAWEKGSSSIDLSILILGDKVNSCPEE